MMAQCGDCDEMAIWTRHTQFAGNHLFCDTHARRQSDFTTEYDEIEAPNVWWSVIEIECSFCGGTKKISPFMVADKTKQHIICDGCVQRCDQLIKQEKAKVRKNATSL